MRKIIIALTGLVLLPAVSVQAQVAAADSLPVTTPKLFVVGTAHLDTQWRWTIQKTISDYIPDTFRKNITLMKQYPDYVFSFEGAFRYMLMKEYYPDEFEQVRPFIKSGQWRVTGSWLCAVDVNVPSFESLVRQTLYGNGYFKREFGKTSRDIFLPDCFGFGYALPSIAAHCGLKSISTQKLTWGGWIGIPFDIGMWEGVDGSQIAAALNPGSYGARFHDDLSRDTTWLSKAERQGNTSGLYAAYRYFGTGDIGGSPDSASVDWLDKSMHSDGPLKVFSIGADDLVDIVATTDTEKLPHFNGELVMTRHGVGCYTSEAAMKRWNRKNELLADAAERASVIAHRMGGVEYPRELLRDAWVRFLWHQFHDDVTGTSIPEAYEFSWNDELLSQNRFASTLEHAVEASSPALNTRCDGIPLVVYNALAVDREDAVAASVYFAGGAPQFVRVYDPANNEIAADVERINNDSLNVRFLASAPSVGYAVYVVRPAKKAPAVKSELKITDRSLENERYSLAVNDMGDVVSIFDKTADKELLSAPIQFQILTDTPKNWPAWEIDYDDIMSAPLDLWSGPATIKVKEDGSARIALEVTRKTAASTIRTTIGLAAGSPRIEFAMDIDWYERGKLLKLCLPVTSANDSVWYDLGLGAIKRGLNSDSLYEVPGQQWADISSPDGSYGVAILNDCRYGWDHPTSDKLRLTLVRTPGVGEDWGWVQDQQSMDNGHHQLTFAIQGHRGDWRQGNVAWQAAALNQPLVAFQTSSHDGQLGKKYSFVRVSTGDSSVEPAVMINAIKQAEESDEIVVRVRELHGEKQPHISLLFNQPVLSAREINGSEEDIGPATIENGQLICSLTPFQPKAFAVKLAPIGVVTRPSSYAILDLPFNLDGISLDDDRCDGDFDGYGHTLAGELIPDTLVFCDVPFVFGPISAGALNTVQCTGQTLTLSQGKYNRIYILAAAVNGPTETSFAIDEKIYPVTVLDYAEPIGQWNNRLAGGVLDETIDGIAPAYINHMPVAWYGSHRHNGACENDIYQFTYLFLVRLDILKGADKLILPADENIRVMAATAVNEPYNETRPTQPLYDETHNTLAVIAADSSIFAGAARVTMSSPVPYTKIHYTLDGSEPTAQSAVYTEPLVVTNTTTVKARGIKAGVDDSHVTTRTVRKMLLRDASPAENLAAGLNCSYYEGEWEEMPDFDSMVVIKTFTADTIAIPELARDEDYGLVFRGYVHVPTDGIYSFYISSDDGSQLFVDDSMVVNNDGIHGDWEESGLIGLKAGYHRFAAHMFQHKGGQSLSASIAGPALPKQALDAAMLNRKP